MGPNLACALTWRFSGAEQCLWHQRDEGRGRPSRFWERLAVRNSSCFVSNSDQGTHFLMQELLIPKERIHFIPNAVDPSPPMYTRKQWRENLGITENTTCVCMVANLHAHKDHATLLRAWQLVQKRWETGCGIKPLPLLLLAGRFGNTADRLQKLARESALANTVRFLGPVNDISGLLGAVDLGVFSSYREGMPNAVLEYCAAGLAVVATDIPGTRAIVGEKANHWLTPPKDPGALAVRLLELLENVEVRRRTGECNRFRAEKEFGPERLISTYKQLFRIP